MSSSAVDLRGALATNVRIKDEALTVDLADGRVVSVPIAWYPRLLHGSVAERNDWRLIGGGSGIHWQGLDEDVSIANLLAGCPSGESPTYLIAWLEHRAKAQETLIE